MEEQFRLLFDKMKLEMKNQNSELTETLTNSILKKIDEKLEPIIVENNNLQSKVKKLENEIQYLKRERKENNIIIFGLEENDNTTQELLQQLKIKFKTDFDLNLEDYEINKIFRIGNKNKEGGKPRPLLVSLLNNWKKNEILKNKKKCKDLYISEDYSKEVLEKRKSLQMELREERNKGNIAYLKYDKLIVKGKIGNPEKRKRDSSTSPGIGKSKKHHNLMSTANRANAFDVMRQRSNSLSSLNPSGNVKGTPKIVQFSPKN